MNKDKETSVNSEIVSLDKLLTRKLVIPSYQRPYIWGTDQLDKLIDDLAEFAKNEKQAEYFMGSILLYAKNPDNHCSDEVEYEIIDGQQRLTSLLIFKGALGEVKEDELKNFKILPVSIDQVRKNFIHVKNRLNNNHGVDWSKDLFPNILFNRIITPSQDEAFTFFDTQNSRGVRPSQTVQIKAYHLRAPNISESENIINAKQWESLEKTLHEFGIDNLLESLIGEVFWRVRNWQGQWRHLFENENQDSLVREFNQRARSNKSGRPSALSIRAPLYQGTHTFTYLVHYTEVIKKTCFEPQGTLYSMVKNVYRPNSSYLMNFFLLGVVTYFDRFQHERLYDFAIALTRLITIVRLKNSRIYHSSLESAYLRVDVKQNLLDMILLAHDPEEVLEKMHQIEQQKLGQETIESLCENLEKNDQNNQPKNDHVRKRFVESLKSAKLYLCSKQGGGDND